jgi:hypothetical protein
MGRFSDFEHETVASLVTERFLAHAYLCRQIATRCRDEDIARKLEQLAQECLRAAGNFGGQTPRH